MRLRQPLNGLKFARGNPGFHFALFIGSLVVCTVSPEKRFKIADNLEIYKTDSELMLTLVRYVHLLELTLDVG